VLFVKQIPCLLHLVGFTNVLNKNVSEELGVQKETHPSMLLTFLCD
jgi:hypothetical protein